ncbi:GntR family transcriptional regulator [Paracoccus sp. (in: a-proteobacteria)]|uniref:GntR family transcriptional regulator n=1 Tax=Paracoccus sp. TaxID=267 RepID=UPI003A8A2BDB
MSIVRVADLRQQVYENVRSRIYSGEFGTDATFHEIALAEELGVSRTPVREALAILARDGLLVQERRGFRFPRLNADDIGHVTDVRLRLEPYAMGQIVADHTPAELARLAGFIRKEISAHRDSDSYIAAHSRMREEILAHIGNPFLADMIRQFDHFAHVVRNTTLREQRWRDKSAEGNLRKADAFQAGDRDEIQNVLCSLIRLSASSYIELLKTQEH